MIYTSFYDTAKKIRLNRQYIYFAIIYGLSTLILPLGVQYLVNNLALSGIVLNLVSFMLLIGVGLIMTNYLRHCQTVIMEYIQRCVFVSEIRRWEKVENAKKSHYYFEVFKVLKSFSKTFSSLIEIALILIFGLVVILLFHPAFLILPMMIAISMFLIHRESRPAVLTSIRESDVKYRIYDEFVVGRGCTEALIDEYLSNRDTHFRYVRRHSINVSILNVLCHVFLLGMGTYFVKTDQLSVGQLVSAEIIMTNILSALSKLPETLESFYDYETSEFKLRKALLGVKEYEH
jgi:ABC-type protease/lipase transport system fused ATPase/permease subunit